MVSGSGPQARGNSRQILAAILLLMLAVAAALGLVYRQIAVAELTERGTLNHQALVQVLATALWSEIEPVVLGAKGKPAADLARHRALPAIDRRINDEIRNIPGVLKLKVFDLQGRVVYSSDAAQIGGDSSKKPGFVAARNGLAQSELTHRGQVSKIEGTVAALNELNTYVPVRIGSSRQIEGVLEIYSNVSTLIDAIDAMALRLSLAAAAGFALVYGFLAFLLLRAERRAQTSAAAEAAAAATAVDATHMRVSTERRLHVITENMPGMIAHYDNDLRLTYCNDQFARWLDFQPEAMTGVHLSELAGAENYALIEPNFRRVLAGESLEYERPHGRPEDSSYVEVKLQPARDAAGNVTGCYALVTDISARRRDQARIAHLAYHDALTGLPNRALVQDRIAQAMARAQRDKNSAAVLFLDLDHFKQINDSLGHAAGDSVLKECARRISECLREADTVGRFGGDEFVVLLPDTSSAADAAQVAVKLMEVMRAPFRAGTEEFHLGLSAGIALGPGDGDDAPTLIRNADVAMYHAKQAGRGAYRFFTANLNADATRRLSLETDLRHGLERAEFTIEYQPQIDLVTGTVAGLEALVRWRRGAEPLLVPPGTFIPICEEIGLIHDLGAWVLREACLQTGQWLRAGLKPVRVAVNVSARQIHQVGFVELVQLALKSAALAPHQLEIEITESLMLDRRDETIAILTELRAIGVKLSLDDFGTGYSSLAYLKRFPVDVIKIDQSFVREVHLHHGDAAMVDAMLALARGLDLDVIAEGVETLEQAEVLRAMNCPIAQGFYFSRPLGIAACTEFLRAAGETAPVAR